MKSFISPIEENREEQEQEKCVELPKEIKGVCCNCLFIKQEWTIEGAKQQKLVLDTYCFLCDIFKSPTGYCDCWEAK